MKKSVRAGTYLAPVPVVLVSCGREKEANLITLAWAGTVNSEPPIVSISIRYQRHSYKLARMPMYSVYLGLRLARANGFLARM